jgi:toxin ParE1/3/4
MMDYVLSPRAQADIDEIWDYSADRWDIDQANRYIAQIRRAIETIATDPRRGRSCDELRRGYRRFSVGSHVLFFRIVGGQLDVVRVLHQSVDFGLHL